jgi:hypothetical protein
VTSKLDARVEGGKVILNYDKAKVWPGKATTAGDGLNANPWIIVEVGGRWYAGTFEWLRFGQTSKPQATVAGDHVKRAPLSDNWRPASGQIAYVMVSGLCRHTERNVEERTNPVKIVWP